MRLMSMAQRRRSGRAGSVMMGRSCSGPVFGACGSAWAAGHALDGAFDAGSVADGQADVAIYAEAAVPPGPDLGNDVRLDPVFSRSRRKTLFFQMRRNGSQPGVIGSGRNRPSGVKAPSVTRPWRCWWNCMSWPKVWVATTPPA